VEKIIAFDGSALTLPRCDFKVSTFDLPGLLGGRPELHPTGSYLAADPALAERWRRRLDALDAGHRRLRVGIAWAGRPDNIVESRRRLPLQPLAELAARHASKAMFVSLQKGASGAAELRALALDWPDLGNECADFA